MAVVELLVWEVPRKEAEVANFRTKAFVRDNEVKRRSRPVGDFIGLNR
jgi:hypothetical protein